LKRIRRIIDMSSFEGLIGGVDYGGEWTEHSLWLLSFKGLVSKEKACDHLSKSRRLLICK
jgi:hypothetical protein